MTFPNLSLIQTNDFIGQLPGTNVKLHVLPTLPPACVTAVINWADYGVSSTKFRTGVYINIAQTSQQTIAQLDAIRSVKIDNSYCPVPMYLVFPDTGDVVTCPPYGIVQTPVLTNGLLAKLYGDGFYTGRPPQTTVQFFNGELEPLYIPGDLISAVQYRYLGKSLITSNVNIGVALPVVNPSPLPPSASRLVVAFVLAKGSVAGAFTFASLTCNGIPLTIPGGSDITVIPNPPNTYSARLAMAYGIVPTGAAFTFQLTTSIAATRAYQLMAYTLDDYTNVNPVVAEDGSTAETSLVATFAAIPGAVGLFSGYDVETALSVGSFVGADINDIVVSPPGSGADFEMIAASRLYRANANEITIYSPGNLFNGAIWI